MSRFDKIANRVAAKTEGFSEISFKVKGDAANSLVRMLHHIKSTGSIGHSFQIVVDPDSSEYRETYGFDGDGADRIDDIRVDGKPAPDEK